MNALNPAFETSLVSLYGGKQCCLLLWSVQTHCSPSNKLIRDDYKREVDKFCCGKANISKMSIQILCMESSTVSALCDPGLSCSSLLVHMAVVFAKKVSPHSETVVSEVILCLPCSDSTYFLLNHQLKSGVLAEGLYKSA